MMIQSFQTGFILQYKHTHWYPAPQKQAHLTKVLLHHLHLGYTLSASHVMCRNWQWCSQCSTYSFSNLQWIEWKPNFSSPPASVLQLYKHKVFSLTITKLTTLPVSHFPAIHTRIHPCFQGRCHNDLHMLILHPFICLHHNGVQSPQHQFPIQTRSAPPVSLRVTSHSF